MMRMLIYTVINNAVKGLRQDEFQIFKKVDTSYKVRSKTLEKVVSKFNPNAKNINVIIERVYERKKRDYFTTLTVVVDDYVELFTPATFVNFILSNV